MANRNWANGRAIGIPQVRPVLLNCSFTVASGNGAGITGLTGPNIANVFMHTTTTPSGGNPNPASGTILVRLRDGYNRLLGFMSSLTSPQSGVDVKIDNSAMTVGVAYVITTLGNASAAKWVSIGVPIGVTPAVGVAFIAATNGGAGNTLTSRVQTAAATGSGIFSIEQTGNGTLALNPLASANQGYGGQLIFQTRKDTTDAPAIAAPADGTVISMSFYLSDSIVTVSGQ